MGLYPFGYVLIIIIGVILFDKNSIKQKYINLFILELIFACSYMNYGYFIKLESLEIEYNDILLGVLFILSVILFVRDRRLKRKTFILSIILLAIVFLGMIISGIFPADVEVISYGHSWDRYFQGDSSQLSRVKFSMQSVLMFFRLIIFVVIMNIIMMYIDRSEWINIGEKVIKYMKWIIIFAIFEVVLKLGLKISLFSYLNIIFGRGISTQGSITRLQGLTREPSYHAIGLFFFIVVAITVDRINKTKQYNNLIWVSCALIIGILSTSFTFYICIFTIILLVLYFNAVGNPHRQIVTSVSIFILLAVGISIITSNWFIGIGPSWKVLNRVAESVIQIRNGLSGTYVLGRDASSEASRLIGGILSLKAGLNRPLLGLGIGTVYCTMGIICIFANIGLIGLICWIRLLFKIDEKGLNRLPVVLVLLPAFFNGDLYTLYNVSYLLIIPLISLAIDTRRIAYAR